MPTDMAVELSNAIPVLVGGAIAIAGGIIGQWATHYFARKREREKLFLEMAESLVTAIYAHRDWLQQQRGHLLFGKEEPTGPNPIDRVWALRDLYFPSLREEVCAVNDALLPITAHVFDHALERMRDKEQFFKNYDNKVLEELMDTYYQASERLLKAVAKEVRASFP